MVKEMLSNLVKIALEIKFTERVDKIVFSLKEIIILASIVEKEAKFNDEKNRVSSVFYNRLKIGMKLQSCATIQYIFCLLYTSDAADDLTRVDLGGRRIIKKK